MNLAPASSCTGCGACKQICPQKAIQFRDDKEGFPTPYIDSDKCVECGACCKICPILYPNQTHPILEAYAAQSLDHEMLMDSTSGGLFTTFSREIFRRGGVVYGCVWDDHYNAIITKAENEAELKPMRGSKYVWSWAGDTFPEVKSLLDNGKTVLFSGLPCQVAGLKSFLQKDYINLFTLDFLCSGAPSPLAFHKWLDSITVDATPKVFNLKFRDKNPYGWGVHITYNGKKERKHKGEHITNPYYYAFYSHLIIRCGCFQCSFGTDQRISDITIGDYWGAEKYHSNMCKSDGISAMMINTRKGLELLEHVTNDIQLEITKKENIGRKNSLKFGGAKSNRSISPVREDFFKEVKMHGWKIAEKKYLHDKHWLKLRIKLFVPNVIAKFAIRILQK